MNPLSGIDHTDQAATCEDKNVNSDLCLSHFSLTLTLPAEEPKLSVTAGCIIIITSNKPGNSLYVICFSMAESTHTYICSYIFNNYIFVEYINMDIC